MVFLSIYMFIFCFLIYVVFLNCIQLFSFVCCKYYVHNNFHITYRVAMMLVVSWITGETSRQFQMRFKEYVLAYKYNYSNWAYIQHLINHGDSLCHMEDIMDVIFTTHKGQYLDTVQKYPHTRKRKKAYRLLIAVPHTHTHTHTYIYIYIYTYI